MNVMDFLRGLGSSVASNNPVTMAVDTAANVADLGIAAAGYLGHKSGMLSTEQLPDPLDKSKIPGSSAWLDKQAGVNDSTEATVGSLAGMFVQPGKALNKVFIETRKLPGGEAAANKMDQLMKVIHNPDTTAGERAKAQKMFDLARKSQRTSYHNEIGDYMTLIPDDPALLNKPLFNALRNGEVTNVRLLDLYDQKTLKKILPKEFWDVRVRTIDGHPGTGSFGAGINFWKTRKVTNALGEEKYIVQTPYGPIEDPFGGPIHFDTREAANSFARRQAREWDGDSFQGTINIAKGGNWTQDATTFFHELQHATSLFTGGYHGANYGATVKGVGDYLKAMHSYKVGTESAKIIKDMVQYHKKGLGIEDWAEVNGFDPAALPGKYRDAWEFIDNNVERGRNKYKYLSDKYIDEIPANAKMRMERIEKELGLSQVDRVRANELINTMKEMPANELAKAEQNMAYSVYARHMDEQLARANSEAALSPWKDPFDAFDTSGPSIAKPHTNRPGIISEPILKGDPNLFFDPAKFNID